MKKIIIFLILFTQTKALDIFELFAISAFSTMTCAFTKAATKNVNDTAYNIASLGQISTDFITLFLLTLLLERLYHRRLPVLLNVDI